MREHPLPMLHALHQPSQPRHCRFSRRTSVPEALDISAEGGLQQRIDIAVVVVKRIPADAAALHDVLDGDPLHGHFIQQLEKGVHNRCFRKS